MWIIQTCSLYKKIFVSFHLKGDESIQDTKQMENGHACASVQCMIC